MLFNAAGDLIYQNPASLRIHGFERTEVGTIAHENVSATWKAWDDTGRPITFILAAAVIIAGSSFDGANWPAAAACFGLILPSVMAFSLFLGNFAVIWRDWIVVR